MTLEDKLLLNIRGPYKSRAEIMAWRETSDPMRENERLRSELADHWERWQELRSIVMSEPHHALVDCRNLLLRVFNQATDNGDKAHYYSCYADAKDYLKALGLLDA